VSVMRGLGPSGAPLAHGLLTPSEAAVHDGVRL
jgi:hypothetical protein